MFSALITGVSTLAPPEGVAALVGEAGARAQTEPDPFDQSVESPPSRALLGDAVTPAGPGAMVAEGALLNATTSELVGPVRVEIGDLPPGIALVSMGTTAGILAEVDWACVPLDTGVVCTLVDAADLTTPVSLPAESLAPWRMILRVADTADLGSGVRITMVAGTDGGALTAPLALEFAAPAEGDLPLLARIGVPAELGAGETAVTTVDLIGLAAGGTDPGSIRVTGLVPGGSTDWEAEGEGWSCVGGPEGPSCTLEGGPGAGEEAARLTVSYRAPRDLGDTTFATVVEAAVNGVLLSWSEAQETTVVPGALPQLLVTAHLPESIVVTPPAEVPLQVRVQGVNVGGAAGPLMVRVGLPPGISAAPIDGTRGWACDQADSRSVTCTAPVGEVFVDTASGPVASLELTLEVATDTPPGLVSVAVESSIGGVPGDSATGAESATTVDLVLAERDVAFLEPVVLRGGPGGELEPVLDGAPLELTVGTRFGLGARNLGSVPSEPDDGYGFEVRLPAGLRVEPSASGWVCERTELGAAPFVVGTRLACTAEPSAEVAPDGEVPPLILTVTGMDRRPGSLTLPVSFSQSPPGGGEAGEGGGGTIPMGVPVLLDGNRPFLSVDVTTVELTSGRDATVDLELSNLGRGPTSDWSVLVDLGVGSGVAWGDLARARLRGSADSELSCRPGVPVRSGLFANLRSERLIECLGSTVIEPSEGLVLSLPVSVAADADGDTRLLVRPEASEAPGEGNDPAIVDLRIVPPLKAVATSLLGEQAAGTGVVVLDGRDSTGAETWVWRQVPVEGEEEPEVVVRWDDGTLGGERAGRLVRIRTPEVDTPTTLAFELVVGSGSRTDSTRVTVRIAPDTTPGKTSPSVTTPAPTTPAVAHPQPRADDLIAALAIGDSTWAAYTTVVSLDPSSVDWHLGYTTGVTFYLDPYLGPEPVGSGTFPAGSELFELFPLRYHNDSLSTPNVALSLESVRIFTPCSTPGGCDVTTLTATISPIDGLTVYTIPGSEAPSVKGAARTVEFRWVLGYPDASTPILEHLVRVPVSEPVPTVDPAVSGSIVPADFLGDSVTLDPGGWNFSPTQYTYAVYSCDDASLTGCVLRQTLTSTGSTTYTPAEVDAGRQLKVDITASNANGPSVSPGEGLRTVDAPAFSTPLVETSPTTVSAPVAGVAATYTIGTFAPAGWTIASQRWQVCDDPAATVGCTDVGIGVSHIPVVADVNHYLRVLVTVSDGTDQAEFASAARLVTGPAATSTTTPGVTVVQDTDRFLITVDPGTWSGVVSATSTVTLYSCPGPGSALSSCSVVGTPAVASGAPVPVTQPESDAALVGRTLVATVEVLNWAGLAAEIAAAATSTEATVPEPDPVNDPGSPPAVLGVLQVGSVLTVDPGLWYWGDALATSAPLGTALQWESCDGGDPVDLGTCAAIAGATATSYQPVQADVGRRIRAVLTVTNSWGRTGTATTGPSALVAAFTLTPTVSPDVTIPGGYSAPHVGQDLTLSPATWNSLPGDPVVTRIYQWQRCSGACTDIAGATGTSYTVTTADLGQTLVVAETAFTSAGSTGSATSVATNPVETNLPVVGAVTPLISGAAQVGADLSLNPGQWSSWDGATVTTTATWYRCDTPTTVLATDTLTYTVTDADVGSTLCASVVATSVHGSAPPLAAPPTAAVTPRDPPTITGSVTSPLVVGTGQAVTLTLGGAGFAPLSLNWSQLDTGEASLDPGSFSGGTLSFVTPASGTGTYSFVFTVTQGDGQSTSTQVDVEYREGVAVSVAEGTTVQVPGGTATTLSATATGVGPFAYTWTQISGPVVALVTTGDTVEFTPPPAGDGSLVLEVTVTDVFGATDTATVRVDYRQPVAISVGQGSIDVAGDVDVTITAQATGLAPLTYTWSQIDDSTPDHPFVPVDLVVNGPEVTIHTPATGGGSILLRVVVTSTANGESASHDFVVNYAQTVGVTIPSTGGEIAAVGGVPLTIGSEVTGVGPFLYRWTQTSGPPALDSDTVVNGPTLAVTPPATGDGTLGFRLELTATNGVSVADVVVRYVQPAVITSISPSGEPSVPRGSTVRLSATATALEPVGVWTQVSGEPVLPPEGVVADETDVIVPATGGGTLVFEYTVTGGNGQTASARVSVSYAPPEAPPGLCEVVSAVKVPGTNLRLGDRISFSVGTGTAVSGDCDADLQASFRRADLVVDGVFALTDASGTVDATGVRITSGTMTVADAVFGDLTFRLGEDGLRVDFGGEGFSLSGDLEADGFAFVEAPAGWTATTRVGFRSGAEQGIEVEATATGPDGPASRLHVAGAYGAGGALALEGELAGVVSLGGADLTLTGGVRREARGADVTSDLGVTVTDPVVVADGVRITSGILTLVDGVVSGDVTVGLGDFVVTGAMTVADSRDWRVEVSADLDGPVSPAPGLELRSVRVSGRLVRSEGDLDGSLALAADWTPATGVEVSDASFVVDLACQADAPCTTTLTVEAGVAVGLDGTPMRGRLTGSVDRGTGAMSLVATLDRVVFVPGLEVRGAELHIERSVAGSGAAEVWISLAGEVFGSAFDARLQVDDRGWWFTTTLGAVRLGDGIPTMRDVQLAYASTPRTVRLAGESRSLAGGALTLAGSMTSPRWIGDLTGSRPEMTVVGAVDPTRRRFDLVAALPDLGGTRLLDVGGVGLTVDSVAVSLDNTSGLLVSRLSGEVTFRLPGVAGASPTSLPLVLEGGPSGDGRSFDATLSLRPGTRWNNAFGLPGLDVLDLSVALQVGMGSGAGRLGLAGTAILPGSVTRPLGIRSGTPITLAAQLGAGPPCFAFEIGDGTTVAVDLLNTGVLTARQAALVVAPAGCRIGEFVYPPGMSFGFRGEVLSVPVDVSVAVDPLASVLQAEVSVGRISLAGLSVEQVEVTAYAGPTRQELDFSGVASLLGATATVEGSFQRGPAGVDVALSGTFSGVEVGGFEVGDLEAGFVTADGMRDLTVTGSGTVEILGRRVEAEFEFQLVNGRLDRARGSGRLRAEMPALTLDTAVAFDLSRGRFPDITLVGEAEAAGLRLAGVTGRVTPRGLSLLGSLDLDPVLNARLGGWVAFDHNTAGAEVRTEGGTSTLGSNLTVPADARPGDFELTADNVRIGLGGFDLRGRVRVASRGGIPEAEVAATLRLGLGSDLGAVLDLQGELGTGGALDLSGEGSLRVAGMVISGARFTAVSDPVAGEVGLSVEGVIRIAGSGVGFAGAFERRPGYGTLFRLYGVGDLSVGSFEFIGTRLLLVRDAAPRGEDSTTALRELAQRGPASGAQLVDPACGQGCGIRSGLVGAASLRAPAVGTVDMTVAVSPDGGMAFDGVGRLEGTLGRALGRSEVAVAVFVEESGRTEMRIRSRVNRAFGIPTSFLFEGLVTTEGILTASVRAEARVSGGVSIGVAEVKASALARFSLDLRVDLDQASEIDAGATIRARVRIRGKTFASGWRTLLTLSATGSTNPYRLRVRIRVFGHNVSIRLT